MTEWPVLALLSDQWRRGQGMPTRGGQSMYVGGDLYEASVQGDTFEINITRGVAASQESRVAYDKLELEMSRAVKSLNGAKAAVEGDRMAGKPNQRNQAGLAAAQKRVQELTDAMNAAKPVEKTVERLEWPMSVFGMQGL